ncbi:MAG TPA: hypothetical protein VEW03_01535, partial [Longimicrobiaceae bacterium]|nr:hypothetical protein [Longimicrobiaceae bacterium]
RLGRSLLALGLAWAEGAALNGLVEVSLRRGDLTVLAERRVHADAIRRSRLRSGAALLLWAGLLVVPAVAGFARVAYAAAAVVWLLPRRPLRLTRLSRPSPPQSLHVGPPPDS